jgi:F-type H+-transporting ATPase subunit a
MFSPLSQFDVISVIPVILCSRDITITNLVFSVFFVIILIYVLLYEFYGQRILPKNWQIFLENLYLFVLRIVNEQTGHSGLIYFPFIFSLFLFILFLNLFSLLPFSFAVTSHLFWTLYFSLSICLGIFLLGLFSHGVEFLKLFVPEVPLFLYPLMISIELFSYIIRSFSLAIRLSANLLAGHTLVHILGQFIVSLLSLKKFIFILPYMLLFAIFVLEFGVACLQAYIFVTLICMYLNDSIHLASH